MPENRRLLAAISAARPKIANYPFTTLSPNLGVVEVGDQHFVVADIPGLIEGAHTGIGLGHDFLRHIERTRILVHVIDTAGTEGRDPLEDFVKINNELRLYQPDLADRLQLVALNKQDLPDARDQVERSAAVNSASMRSSIFPIAAATGEGVAPLLQKVAELLTRNPESSAASCAYGRGTNVAEVCARS